MGFPSSFDGTGHDPATPNVDRLTTTGWEPTWVWGPPPARSAWKRWGRNLLLFLLTVLTVFLVGGLTVLDTPDHRGTLAIDLAQGALMVVSLLSILVAHEMGHYLTCRYYGVDASLPYFIPLPLPPAGTLGAFIRIRAPFPNRRILFDIGIAGPLAGFVVLLPWLWLGVAQARVVPHTPSVGEQIFGEPLLFQWFSHLVHGTIPDGSILAIGTVGMAAWFGLFVTALNLMPIGQLDGGHVTYSLFRDKAHLISRIGSWVCVALIYFGPNWILWAILLRLLGRRHPATLDDAPPVGRGRAVLAFVSLVVFVLCFVPDPIVWSWRDFFAATGLQRFLP